MSSEELFDALIIDPEPESRMRLKQATANCSEFRQVKLASSLYHALKELKDSLKCNIIYISQAFEAIESATFVQEAKETINGQYCAYIMIVNGRQQTRTGVATSLSNGMDGFLFQPFSVNALRETTALAAQIRGKTKTVRAEASKHLLTDPLIPLVEKHVDLFLEGKKRDFVKADLRVLIKGLANSFGEDSDAYYSAIIDLFEGIEAPPQPKENDFSIAARKRRRRMEEEIAARAANVEHQEAAQDQKGPGGYFTRKRKG